MESLSVGPEHSVVILDGIPEPCVALRSRTFFELINLLDSCRGFVAGMKAKEEAVALGALLHRLNEIAVDYEAVAGRNGYELEIPKSQAQVEFEKARQEINLLIAQLEALSKK